MNFHKSICTEQGYSIMLTIILSLRIWFGKKLFIKVQEKNPCLFINSMKLNYLKKKKKKDKRKKKVSEVTGTEWIRGVKCAKRSNIGAVLENN